MQSSEPKKRDAGSFLRYARYKLYLKTFMTLKDKSTTVQLYTPRRTRYFIACIRRRIESLVALYCASTQLHQAGLPLDCYCQSEVGGDHRTNIRKT